MGRELRRVPLDFDWPLNKVWDGYLSPEWRTCPAEGCEHGLTIEGQWVETFAHLILMLGEPSRDGRLHPWLASMEYRPKMPPGERMAELTGGLAGRPPRHPFGHDAVDRWRAAKAIIQAAGLPEDWWVCPTCKGHGIHPDDIEASEAWTSTEPPTGEGYQLWETTSEGSPQTPVFATLDEVCEYAAEHCSTFGSHHASAEGWKQMLTDGLVAVPMQMGDGSTALFM